MSDQYDFSFLPGTRTAGSTRRAPNAPLRLLVVGDFSGRGASGAAPQAAPATRPVDFDNFDALIARTARATLAFGGEQVELSFESLDDFHPDALLQRVPALQLLMQQRKQLRDPQQAAALLGQLEKAAPAEAPTSESATKPRPESQGSMFERLLGSQHQPSTEPAVAGLDQWVTDLVRPHLAPVTDPRAADLTASLEKTAADLLREILHHRAFQQLESTWRGLHWLLQNLELSEELQVAVLDLTKAELGELAATDDLQASWLYRLLVDQGGADFQPFSMVVGLHAFGPGESDVRTLAMMGALGSHAGFSFVATATPEVLGCDDLAADPSGWKADADAAARWQALRACPQASNIGLALPRFVLRLPYGSADPIDTFEFDEMPMPPETSRYLWGAPGLAIARLLGSAFADQGWEMRAIDHEVGGLPWFTWRSDGTTHMQPCTEVLWADRAATAADSSGLMVLQGHANRDAARLMRLRSIADPATTLAGPWRM